MLSASSFQELQASNNNHEWGWMDGWMDGWVVGWMDGWVVGWMDTFVLGITCYTNNYLVQ
jgi:hypothetical protein